MTQGFLSEPLDATCDGESFGKTMFGGGGQWRVQFWRYKGVDAKLHIQVETSSGQVDMEVYWSEESLEARDM